MRRSHILCFAAFVALPLALWWHARGADVRSIQSISGVAPADEFQTAPQHLTRVPPPVFVIANEAPPAAADLATVLARLLAGSRDSDDDLQRTQRRRDFETLAGLDQGDIANLADILKDLEATTLTTVEETEIEQEDDALGAQRALLVTFVAQLADAESRIDALGDAVRERRIGVGFEIARQLPLGVRRRLAAALTRAIESAS